MDGSKARMLEALPLSLERPTNAEPEFEDMVVRAMNAEVVSVPGIGMLPPTQFLGGLR